MQPLVVSTYRFGPFEVNAASGELLKHGERVRLQDQPFRLLVVLLEHAGEVVTREEIRTRLWDGDTFVDFEGSLRAAVRKLREALADDADQPRYIETVPKRGYRFLGRVVQAADSPSPVIVPEVAAARSNNWRPFTVGLIISVIVLGIVVAAFVFFPHHSRILTEKDTVVLSDFANSTGDPVFDGTLRQGMSVQLEQSPFLSLISEGRIQQELRLMNQPPGAGLTAEMARQICERTASAAVLDGSIRRLGSQYVLGLRASNCHTGEILVEKQVQAAKKEDVLNALDRIASEFRTRLGESLNTVEKHNTPLAEATTPSLEALKAYSSGWKVAGSEGESAALPLFKRAVEIDPKFASAYAALGLVYGATGESALATENITKAYDLREHASDDERFFIAAYYDGRATGNQEKARQTCIEWARSYPREVTPHAFLAGFIYPAFGEFQEAIHETEKAIALDPDGSIGYVDLISNNIALGRLAEARAAIAGSAVHKIEMPLMLIQRYDLAFLENDQAEMDRQATLAQGKMAAEDWMAQRQAFAMAYSGRLQQAKILSRRAQDLAKQTAHSERAALFETDEALWEAMFENAEGAKRTANTALALANDREVEYGTAFALALAGDSVHSQTLTDDLDKKYPEDTAVRFSYLPTLHALASLNQGQPGKAIEFLQVATSNELGMPRSALQGFFGSLYPIYVRGEAYLALHQGREAAAEFQKILDHRGTTISDPIGALAHLQLARAYELSGDRDKAKSSYESFLSLWKDADASLPVLKKARSEYARLR